MAAQLYANTQLALTLYEVLQELVEEGKVPEPLAVATLAQVSFTATHGLKEERKVAADASNSSAAAVAGRDLLQLDQSVLAALKSEIQAKAEIKGNLDTYKYYDNVSCWCMLVLSRLMLQALCAVVASSDPMHSVHEVLSVYMGLRWWRSTHMQQQDDHSQTTPSDGPVHVSFSLPHTHTHRCGSSRSPMSPSSSTPRAQDP